MIELDEKDYILGFWFAECPRTGNNHLSYVKADPDKKGFWVGAARIRKKVDDKIWNSKDEKRWMSFSSKEASSDEEQIKIMDRMQDQLSIIFPRIDKLIVCGDLKLFLEKAKTKEWMNIGTVDLMGGKKS